jgi:hypothetical protein
VIDPGHTGTFPPDSVSYWYPRMGLPSQTTYVGPGTLEITAHDARPDSRDLVGRIPAGGIETGIPLYRCPRADRSPRAPEGAMIQRLLCATVFLCATACDSGGQEAATTAEAGSGARPAATAARGGDARVVGTIHATIDGEARTWYVLEGEVNGVREASAFWYEPESGAPRALIGGYDTEDVPFHTFGRPGSPAGDYAGSGMTLVVAFPPRETTWTSPLHGDDDTGVLYMPSVVDGPLFVMADGRLEVTSLEAPRPGTGSIAGTFSGTMQIPPGSDRTLTVTDGRFEVEELTFREELPGADRP